jgi:DNA-directed RNA polymerase subunit beta'
VKLNESGASPVENPLKQISGVRGLIVDPAGRIVELPLRSNYKQGLSTLEYFVAARGTRKALADVALKTAESGYLTRKLVDVAQDVITREDDCGTTNGIYLNREEERRIDFVDRITGRVTATEVKVGDKVLKPANELITADDAEEIAAEEDVKRIKVRSVLTCETLNGVCVSCYGYNLGTRHMVDKGMAVGVIAAQAIGEASTQLTLDAKHRSGSASAKDITQGLPRVEELLEVRTPKGKAILSEISGKVKIEEDEQAEVRRIIVTQDAKREETYDVTNAKEVLVSKKKKIKKNRPMFVNEDGDEVNAPYKGKLTYNEDKNELKLKADKVQERIYELEIWNNTLIVEDGDEVDKGQQLTSGSIDPEELMELVGIRAAQKYIIDEIQKTFGIQGIGIDDKHVESTVRQMSQFMQVKNSGDSEYLPGDYIPHIKIQKENEKLQDKDKHTIRAQRMIMGISNASLRTESFLSAASFQDQVRVLTEASILGKVDSLRGLKENVIIGRPVPLGEQLEEHKEKYYEAM